MAYNNLPDNDLLLLLVRQFLGKKGIRLEVRSMVHCIIKDLENLPLELPFSFKRYS